MGAQGQGAPVPLGFFRELGPSLASAPSVGEAIGRGPTPELQRRAAFYLVQGTLVVAVMGILPDVLDGEPTFLSEGIVSDGGWFWRRDLAHYVAKYNIALPKAFLEHAASHQWSPGVLVGQDLQRAGDAIHDFVASGGELTRLALRDTPGSAR